MELIKPEIEFIIQKGNPKKQLNTIDTYFSPDIKVYKKWKELINKIYNPNLFTNPQNLTEEEHKSQIIKGYVIQELTGEWLRKYLPLTYLTINNSIGKDKYDIDDYDILVGDNFKIDVKSSKALRKDYLKTDVIIIVLEEGELYEIQGYWITKELKRFKEMDNYLIPLHRLKIIKILIRKLNKWQK